MTDHPNDLPDHATDEADLDERSRGAQESYVGEQANLRPGEAGDGDTRQEDQEQAEREQMLDEIREEG